MRVGKAAKRLLATSAGTAGVEFAMISVVLVMALVGVIEIGRAIWIVQTLQRAAHSAARYAYTEATDAEITRKVEEALTGLDPAVVSKSVTPETIDGVSYKTIQVSYDFQPLIPLVPIEATITRRARVPQ